MRSFGSSKRLLIARRHFDRNGPSLGWCFEAEFLLGSHSKGLTESFEGLTLIRMPFTLKTCEVSSTPLKGAIYWIFDCTIANDNLKKRALRLWFLPETTTLRKPPLVALLFPDNCLRLLEQNWEFAKEGNSTKFRSKRGASTISLLPCVPLYVRLSWLTPSFTKGGDARVIVQHCTVLESGKKTRAASTISEGFGRGSLTTKPHHRLCFMRATFSHKLLLRTIDRKRESFKCRLLLLTVICPSSQIQFLLIVGISSMCVCNPVRQGD